MTFTYNEKTETLEEDKLQLALPPPRRKATGNLAQYVTYRDLNRFMEAAGRSVAEVIAPLQKRIAELEAKPSMQHRGVWRADNQYQQGDVVSHQGSGWVSKSVNKGAKPGETRLWQMFVKRGRDSKP